MKKLFILVFCSTSIGFGQNGNLSQAPHQSLIKPIVNGMSVYLDEGSPIKLVINTLEINGRSYSYNYYPQKFPDIITSIQRRYKRVTEPTVLIIADKNGELVQKLDSEREVFNGESGIYKMYLNTDTTSNSVNIDGSIFILTREIHRNRNKFNQVAKGVLTKKSDKIYVDERGWEWELQSQCFNEFHNPLRNVKLLRKLKSGGEYETIREVLIQQKEGEFGTIICPLTQNVDAVVIVAPGATKLAGCNVISAPFGGSYNFGHTGAVSVSGVADYLEHKFLDIDPHERWGGNYTVLDSNYPCNVEKENTSTVFLIDTSGSMNGKGSSGKSKWEEAKEAAMNATTSLLGPQNGNQEIAFLTFSGGCSSDPIAGQNLHFSNSFGGVQQQINNISRPGGGTPLNEAVDAATQRLQNYATNARLKRKPKLIVLSDGAATCGTVRPPNVYGTGLSLVPNNYRVNEITETAAVSDAELKNTDVNGIAVKYYTIGFDIRPGSTAERDLQYLAQKTGGKYLNTQNAYELTRAFSKFFRVYRPKLQAATRETIKEESLLFGKGVQEILNEDYEKAKHTFEKFLGQYPVDHHAIFNLALMYEANDYHRQAIAMYEKYLRLFPAAPDATWVSKQIALLQTDKLHFRKYIAEILRSDLAYLEQQFKKIQNGESIALAEEFKGFIQEKKGFYETFADKLGIVHKSKRARYKEVSRGLANCARLIKQDPKNWDKNASPSLSLTFFNLQKAIEGF